MNNGVNSDTKNIIPGAKIAPPKEEHVETLVDTQLSEPIETLDSEPKTKEVNIEPPKIVSSEPVLSPDDKKAHEEHLQVVKEQQLNKVNKKKQVQITSFLLLIILFLVIVCTLMWYSNKLTTDKLNEVCSPVSTTNGSKELDLNSFIVKDLYSKVKTNVREDLEEIDLNDELKVYLAYRQIGQGDIYESHCNMFSTDSMPAFTCNANDYWSPRAFKVETLEREYKKLFGENTVFPKVNIQLGNSCLGGFQYIESRGEYVQGQCKTAGVIGYSADKELINATSKEATIILKEKVTYYNSLETKLPEGLVSGTYEYTFKLDRNYNYIYVGKKLIK